MGQARMTFYADTSFLGSLYLRDGNSAAALAWVGARRRSLPFTPLHRLELRNALRLAVFRSLVSEAVAHQALAEAEQDAQAGDLEAVALDWHEALQAAERIGSKHTSRHGLRSLDLLHLGVAHSLGLKTILTFDQRQQAAARAAGFLIGP